jgi:hypothetical protein
MADPPQIDSSLTGGGSNPMRPSFYLSSTTNLKERKSIGRLPEFLQYFHAHDGIWFLRKTESRRDKERERYENRDKEATEETPLHSPRLDSLDLEAQRVGVKGYLVIA